MLQRRAARSVSADGQATPVAMAADVIVPAAGPTRTAPSASAPVLLNVRGLSKSFGGLKAVQDVSFTVREGEILGIIGPNGAGKTTLFNLLNGILKADSGSVTFAGQAQCSVCPPTGSATSALAARSRSYAPFRACRCSTTSSWGPMRPRRPTTRPMRSRQAALARVGMEHDAHLLAGGLTTKQLRLLELARALAGRPRVLLLDETLAGLGAEAVEDMLAVISAIRCGRDDDRHHRAHHAGDGASGRPFHRAGSRSGARRRDCRRR